MLLQINKLLTAIRIGICALALLATQQRFLSDDLGGFRDQELKLSQLVGDVSADRLPQLRKIATYRGEVKAMATDKQGKYVALSFPSSPHTTLIETSTGKEVELERPADGTGNANWVAISPDGKYLVTGAIGLTGKIPPYPEAFFWETKTGKLTPFKWLGDSRAAYGLYARGGKYFVHVNCDGRVYVRSTETWEVKREFRVIGGIVCFLDICSAGRYLVASNFGGAVSVCDLATGKILSPEFGPISEGYISAISPDGELIANWNVPSTGIVRLRSRKSGEVITSFRGRVYGFHMKFSPDGRWLITCGTSGIAVWDVKNRREHCKIVARERWAAACFAEDAGDMFLAIDGNIYRLRYK